MRKRWELRFCQYCCVIRQSRRPGEFDLKTSAQGCVPCCLPKENGGGSSGNVRKSNVAGCCRLNFRDLGLIDLVAGFRVAGFKVYCFSYTVLFRPNPSCALWQPSSRLPCSGFISRRTECRQLSQQWSSQLTTACRRACPNESSVTNAAQVCYQSKRTSYHEAS